MGADLRGDLLIARILRALRLLPALTLADQMRALTAGATPRLRYRWREADERWKP
jgi:hypothetical protein